jgi:hypothetical protein
MAPSNTYESTDWAQRYVETYYKQPMQDELAVLDWQKGAYDKVQQSLPVGCTYVNALDVGSGPIPLRAFAATPYVDRIHYVDFAPSNRDYLKRWLENEGDHDWTPFVKRIIANERQISPDQVIESDIEMRLSETRMKYQYICR